MIGFGPKRIAEMMCREYSGTRRRNGLADHVVAFQYEEMHVEVDVSWTFDRIFVVNFESRYNSAFAVNAPALTLGAIHPVPQLPGVRHRCFWNSMGRLDDLREFFRDVDNCADLGRLNLNKGEYFINMINALGVLRNRHDMARFAQDLQIVRSLFLRNTACSGGGSDSNTVDK